MNDNPLQNLDTFKFQNQLDAIVRENCNVHKYEWRTYCLRWLSEQLETVDPSGDALLDAKETPELPEQLFYKLNATWEVETGLVQEIVRQLNETVAKQKELWIQGGLTNIEVEGLMQTELSRFKTSQKDRAEKLRNIEIPLQSEQLQQYYKDAQHVSLIERIFHTNYKDVLQFQSHLCETLEAHIDEMIEWHIAKVIEHLVTILK